MKYIRPSDALEAALLSGLLSFDDPEIKAEWSLHPMYMIEVQNDNVAREAATRFMAGINGHFSLEQLTHGWRDISAYGSRSGDMSFEPGLREIEAKIREILEVDKEEEPQRMVFHCPGIIQNVSTLRGEADQLLREAAKEGIQSIENFRDVLWAYQGAGVETPQWLVELAEVLFNRYGLISSETAGNIIREFPAVRAAARPRYRRMLAEETEIHSLLGYFKNNCCLFPDIYWEEMAKPNRQAEIAQVIKLLAMQQAKTETAS